MTIRKAHVDDCALIADIYNHYLGTSTMDTEVKDASYYEELILHLRPRERWYILEIENQVIGWGNILLYSNRHGYRTSCETSVYLDPNACGHGYGSYLKKHIISQCNALGYHHLVAKIMADNEASIAYNEKFGYEIVGTQKEIGMVNGQWKDVVIMQLIL